MPSAATIRSHNEQNLCGLAKWHPEWMQRYATSKMFMAVYGLMGTIQAMSYMYFVVTLTTIEKRFKIPSQTTGIILSGNEISQILLSLILSYIGGQRNRPRWIASGIVFCGISCYILALPHFIYGAGHDVLQYTKEYYDWEGGDNATSSTMSLVNATIKNSQQLCGVLKTPQECESLLSILPLVLIFLSQFVLGIGNTLYYSLGQSYLDDNTKKTNTPLMLSVAFALRLIGPIVGFFLGYVSLNMFIDPAKTPLIDNKDPRWLGAWWFGWMILGTLMIVFSGLIGLFPKELPKKAPVLRNSHVPHVLRHEELKMDECLPLGRSFSSNATLDAPVVDKPDFPQLKDFPRALMRLLRNKLLIFNITSGIFYILGASAIMTFLTKYMEVQFHRNSQSATIVVGPVSILGMVVGLVGSGLILTKKKPAPSKVLMWNVIVGFVFILGQIGYMFLYCSDSVVLDQNGRLNLSNSCNANCGCEDVPYSPICHEETETTFFSPCHAGCQSWNSDLKYYSNCSCLAYGYNSTTTTIIPTVTTTTTPTSLLPTSAINSDLLQPLVTSSLLTTTTMRPTTKSMPDMTTYFDDFTTTPNSRNDDDILSRSRRSLDALTAGILKPGVCLKGCTKAFWIFTIVSMILNWFGSSGRIGNILVNYRAVATEDKSFAQGLMLMMVSLFGLIPGPIIFGRIIDSTCLKWTKTCTGNGNCQLYDQDAFRVNINAVACCFTAIGVFFDVLVWYHGRHLDLYGEREAERSQEIERKNRPITPLLSRK
ncbi:solute carrier organic anion transporter family member 74D [Musca vetustissima]|uniref:solute carrier organic anion transporter family member 74D n=1 Tax=Musca vetustissima TaxID=27455 RepID=UPI002AB7EBD4|nr:solute carrier organic anion transporter family member 74D [Musca vetustissima]